MGLDDGFYKDRNFGVGRIDMALGAKNRELEQTQRLVPARICQAQAFDGFNESRGVAGMSDNIRVRSIVGRYLEHSRIYYFANGGDEDLYLGSADLMERNLDRRVEVLFPVLDPAIRLHIHQEILAAYQKDTVKARYLRSDGSYIWPAPDGDPLVDSQRMLLENPGRAGLLISEQALSG